MYYVYMLRCKDNSLYTGITTNIEKRMEEHFGKSKKCAKYTYVHTAKKLETFWKVENKSRASKIEYHIKTLTKKQKEEIIKDKTKMEKYLGEKLNLSK